MNIPELLDLPALGRDLDEVEAALRRSVGSDDPFLGEVASHLIVAAGKRIRPVLAVAAAAAGGAGLTPDVPQGGGGGRGPAPRLPVPHARHGKSPPPTPAPGGQTPRGA